MRLAKQVQPFTRQPHAASRGESRLQIGWSTRVQASWGTLHIFSIYYIHFQLQRLTGCIPSSSLNTNWSLIYGPLKHSVPSFPPHFLSPSRECKGTVYCFDVPAGNDTTAMGRTPAWALSCAPFSPTRRTVVSKNQVSSQPPLPKE